MSIIVDGYNYIGRSLEFQLSDPGARDKIIYLMGQYCAKAKKTLTLIFDGNYFVHHVNRKRRYGRVTVIYTSPIYTADDAIKKIVKNHEYRRRKSMLVVSSDAEILEYAKSHGANISKSEDFEDHIYRTLAAKTEIDRVNVRISEEDVQEWLKIFGEEPPEARKSSHRTASVEKTVLSSQNRHSVEKPRSKGKKGSKNTSKTRKRSRKKPLPSHNGHDVDRVNVHLSAQEVQEWMNYFNTKPSEGDEE